MGASDYAAWWGAIIATAVLVWDILKWRRSGPRIKARAITNTWYVDRPMKGVEVPLYCHIELVNRGDQTTTVLGIEGRHTHVDAEGEAGVGSTGFEYHGGKSPPAVLRPGEMWSCATGMSHLKSLSQFGGKPYFEVHLSHRDEPLVIWPEAHKRTEQLIDKTAASIE